MNRSKKHLKLVYNKYITGIIRKNGIILDAETKKRLNSRDKKHVKHILNTLYGYGFTEKLSATQEIVLDLIQRTYSTEYCKVLNCRHLMQKI